VHRSDGRYIMGSLAIVDALEALHPTPSLNLDSDLIPQVEHLTMNIALGLIDAWMPKVPTDVISPASID
jgi:hypothetical protein